MQFDELQIQEPQPKVKEQVSGNKRYVLTADPYDEDTIKASERGINVFTVWDRNNQSVSTKIWTNKTFDEFVKWFLKDEETKIPFVISHKFIDKNGKPIRTKTRIVKTGTRNEAGTGNVSSEGYNDTFKNTQGSNSSDQSTSE